MRKLFLVITLVILALGVLGVGVVFAQGERPPYGSGWRVDGFGPLHTYLVEALAAKLDLSVDEVNDRLSKGETMYDIAFSKGIAQDQLPTFLKEVHAASLDKAVADGVITQEQADWMHDHMQSGLGYGYGNVNCPMHNRSFGQDGRGFGPGMMGGRYWEYR